MKKSNFFFLPLLLLSFGVSMVTHADITTGLEASWQFEEGTGTSADDTSSNSYTGTLQNGATWGVGKVGTSSVFFDGSNDQIATTYIVNSFPITFCTWSKATPNPNGFAQASLFQSLSLILYLQDFNDGDSRYTAYDSVQALDAPQGVVIFNQWQHVCSTVNASGTNIIYVDGDPVASGEFADMNYPGYGLTLGVAMSGNLDDMRIYNRALSPSDVNELYLTSQGLTPDITPPVISAVVSSTTSSLTANISWTTSEGATTQVRYGTTTSYASSSTYVSATSTSHLVGLTSLTPGTTYHFRVESLDDSGNIATSSDYTFTTDPADVTAPTISSVSVGTITPSSAVITWSTNEAGTSQVEYGTTTSYTSSTTLQSSYVTSHSATISGLLAGTLYHYRVKTLDSSGNVATSSDGTFTTTTLLGSGLIAAGNLIEWSPGLTVGVPNGIPTNRTQCVTTACNAVVNAAAGYKNGTLDAYALIQAAMNSALPHTYVYIPAGTWQLSASVYFIATQDYVTLRGAGQDSTILDCRGNRCVQAGSEAGSRPADVITSGLTKGSSQITIADASAYTVGEMVTIAVDNDPTVPVVSTGGFGGIQRQRVRITGKTGTTLTFFPTLYDTATGGSVGTSGYQGEYVGVEDLTVDGSIGGVLSFGVMFSQTYASWIKNVKVTHAANYSVYFSDSLNCEMRESFLDRLDHAGSNGAGLLVGGVSGCLFEDNIIVESFPNIEVNHGSSGNVFAYNFMNNESGLIGIDTNHAPHNAYNLYEGNVSHNLMSDGYFGGESETTIFRNWLTGVTIASTSPHSIAGQTYCMSLKRFSRNFSVVGNILGNPASTGGCESYGQPNIGNGASSGTAQPSLGDWWADLNPDGTTAIAGSLTLRTSNTIGEITLTSGSASAGTFLYLYSATNTSILAAVYVTAVTGNVASVDASLVGSTLPQLNTVFDIWPGSGGYQELDLDVASSTQLLANYRNDIDGIASNETTGVTLPDSLFRTSKPAYFGSLAWPAIDPYAPNMDYVTTIPAVARFFNATTTPDTAAPIISSIASTTASSSATITWTTNESATSTVLYGPTSAYGSTS
ncbi:MAG: fibronectin type III domain-containing protein, partial [Patescibacteria group bacterium]